jgi:DNA-binding beta-propeller fold protein YncE
LTLTALAGAASAETLLGVVYGTGELVRINSATAAVTPVGQTGLPFAGGLETGPDGTLYALDHTLHHYAIYTIDAATAEATLVGETDRVLFEGGIAFAPDGTLYGANTGNAFSAGLAMIDPATGASEEIGRLAGMHDMSGLAVRSDGMIIALDREPNALIAINPATMEFTTLAEIDDAVGSVGGMAVAGDTGYFVTAGPGASNPGSNALYRFDLYTGETALVGSLEGVIPGFGLGGLAVLPDAPCEGDLTGDGKRDQQDLAVLLASYGLDAGGDIDGDGDTDNSDLGILLAAYNQPCF